MAVSALARQTPVLVLSGRVGDALVILAQRRVPRLIRRSRQIADLEPREIEKTVVTLLDDRPRGPLVALVDRIVVLGSPATPLFVPFRAPTLGAIVAGRFGMPLVVAPAAPAALTASLGLPIFPTPVTLATARLAVGVTILARPATGVPGITIRAPVLALVAGIARAVAIVRVAHVATSLPVPVVLAPGLVPIAGLVTVASRGPSLVPAFARAAAGVPVGARLAIRVTILRGSPLGQRERPIVAPGRQSFRPLVAATAPVPALGATDVSIAVRLGA